MRRFTKNITITGIAAVIGLIPAMNAIPAEAAVSPPSVRFQLNTHFYSNNSGKHTLAVAPYTVGNTLMVPLRALAESMSATAGWSKSSGTVTITGKTFGKISAKVNDTFLIDGKGNKRKIPERVAIRKGTVFVPVRSIAQAMDLSVSWNKADKSVTIKGALGDKNQLSFHSKFEQGLDGWTGGFADLPVDYNKEIYELSFGKEKIPQDAGSVVNYGLKLNGVNRSDDLFMYITRKYDGLRKNTTYIAKLKFDMYTSESGGMIGIGGAPAEAVYIKAGVLSKAPKVIEEKNGDGAYFRMNLDKGNQGTEGPGVKIVGNAVKPDSGKEGFQRVQMTYEAKVTTNENGELHLLIGSDSGYEGRTTLYFDNIHFTLEK
ncbi:copper amine oxidase N-terminal domain-containing protein [Paenibacillus gansuensis]|uniref:Copper amine oxidase N-terminal domain-containing protein n=1 Tax=Paenibacillus gansuensis TaxID=306542 RepID=A0ABW5PHY0_9BACL